MREMLLEGKSEQLKELNSYLQFLLSTYCTVIYLEVWGVLGFRKE